LVVSLGFTSGSTLADDDQVWAALQEGGKVILLRHTHVVIREGIGRLVPGNCSEEINLSPRGVEQAEHLGDTFRAHGITIGKVLASPYCRCLDTGRLAFGHATAVQYLMPPGAVSEKQAAANDKRVLQEIRNHRGPSNLVMITHDLNIADQVLEPAEMGEFFVLQPNGSDFTVLGKIQLYAQ
jgi:broad specificity phosphatase PhoE